ncbi:tRNA pseudouridine13 synthase [Enteropsectra breve]|nr:tRNA pseudouridine13 synthase [Enteropsectra breve]
MEHEFGISRFYANQEKKLDCTLKECIEDFVVQELTENGVCGYKPIIDISKYKKSKNAYNNIPEMVPKPERKAIYDTLAYFPLRKLSIKNGKFTVEECNEDIYVCTMIKYNINTTDAVRIIASRLGIPADQIQFAGNKDKRGVTFQEISIKCSFQSLYSYSLALNANSICKIEAFGYNDNFEEQNRAAHAEISKEIDILDMDAAADRLLLVDIRKGHSIKLGDNRGNQFTIKIRGSNISFIEPKYFLNYYGPQRFGSYKNNHTIGQLILEKQYDTALEHIMKCSYFQKPNEPKEVEENVKKYSMVQNYILKMQKKGASSKHIVYSIDRLTRMMYMHAWQSYNFNKTLSDYCTGNSDAKVYTREGDDTYILADEKIPIEHAYLELTKHNDKFLKGGYRKVVEELSGFSSKIVDEGVVFCFTLPKSAYATIALREILGNLVETKDYD